jgi:HSP20 family protein
MAQRHPWQLPTPFQEATQEVDRLFDKLIHQRWGGRRGSLEDWAPQLDLYETKTAFVLEADMPGVNKQNAVVTVENGDLVLTGIRSVTHTRQGSNFFHQERRSGQFERRLQLPASVDPERIRATFRNGVLRVTLPKMQTNTQIKTQTRRTTAE